MKTLTVAGTSLLMILLLPGCVNQDIIVDTKGINDQRYQQDLAECQEYTRQISTGTEAARSGVFGTAVGAAIGAIVGNSRTVQKSAGVGAVTGSLKGGQNAQRRKHGVVSNCLRGRGYKVLG
ncbi:MAG: glycine zipper family protein [bacterium]|nr:glycine zipper family protein [Gammaproteobacteria bacterium]